MSDYLSHEFTFHSEVAEHHEDGYFTIFLEAYRGDEDTFRIPRLCALVGHLNAKYPKTLLGIHTMRDNKGELSVFWRFYPTKRDLDNVGKSWAHPTCNEFAVEHHFLPAGDDKWTKLQPFSEIYFLESRHFHDFPNVKSN